MTDETKHAYRAAFFDHPESQQSVECGEWKTFNGLVASLSRNIEGDDSRANLVSIRKVEVPDDG